jgi:hypothetical protein
LLNPDVGTPIQHRLINARKKPTANYPPFAWPVSSAYELDFPVNLPVFQKPVIKISDSIHFCWRVVIKNRKLRESPVRFSRGDNLTKYFEIIMNYNYILEF